MPLNNTETVEVQEGSVRGDLVSAFGGSSPADVSADDLLQRGDQFAEDNPLKGKVPESSDDRAAPNSIEETGDDSAKGDERTGDQAKKDEAVTSKKEGDVEPPVKWTKEEKDTFDALEQLLGPEHAETARKAQQILVNRNKGIEGTFTQRMQALAKEREEMQARFRGYDGIEQMIAPRRQGWQMQGLDDARALQQLFALSDFAAAKPAEFAQWFMQQRGLTPEQFGIKAPEPIEKHIVQVVDQAGNPVDQFEKTVEGKQPAQQQQTPQQAQMPPALMQELAQLRQQVSQLSQHASTQMTQQQAYASQLGEQSIQEFASMTDDSGNPKYPFFEDVRHDMAAIMDANPNAQLEQAYSAAVAAHPEYSQRQMETIQRRWEREAEARRRSEAEAARKAGASLPTSGVNVGSAPADDTSGDLRSMITKAWQQQENRGRV